MTEVSGAGQPHAARATDAIGRATDLRSHYDNANALTSGWADAVAQNAVQQNRAANKGEVNIDQLAETIARIPADRRPAVVQALNELGELKPLEQGATERLIAEALQGKMDALQVRISEEVERRGPENTPFAAYRNAPDVNYGRPWEGVRFYREFAGPTGQVSATVQLDGRGVTTGELSPGRAAVTTPSIGVQGVASVQPSRNAADQETVGSVGLQAGFSIGGLKATYGVEVDMGRNTAPSALGAWRATNAAGQTVQAGEVRATGRARDGGMEVRTVTVDEAGQRRTAVTSMDPVTVAMNQTNSRWNDQRPSRPEPTPAAPSEPGLLQRIVESYDRLLFGRVLGQP